MTADEIRLNDAQAELDELASEVRSRIASLDASAPKAELEAFVAILEHLAYLPAGTRDVVLNGAEKWLTRLLREVPPPPGRRFRLAA